MFLRRLLVGLFLIVLFTWLAMRQPDHHGDETAADGLRIERQTLALGTLISITVWDADSHRRQAANVAIEHAQQLLDDEQARWSAEGDGTLGKINQALDAGQTVSWPQSMQALIELSAHVSEHSGYRFDPRVGELIRVWGFDDEAHFRSSPPATSDLDKALDALKQAPPLTAADHYGPAPGVMLDFGAIAKGWIVDQVSRQLRADGFPNHLINAGGNVRTSGAPGKRPWNIGIRHPRPESGPRMLATLRSPGDESVITSGDYERYFEYQGQRYHHILDPAAGQPARGLESVTVVARDGGLADAASTAIFVAGPQWRTVAAQLGLDQVMVVTDQGQVMATRALAQRLRPAEGVKIQTVP